MPPKARITKEMVIEAGLNIVRSEGTESLNVRRIAAELKCSTQPVMYHYKTVDELKADIYAAADAFHTEYITTPNENAYDPLLSIGLNYIRFAEEERFLFRFLFQSDKFRNIGFREMLDGEEHDFLIQPLAKQTGLAPEQAKTVFETLFICVHGYASMLANNSMEYSEEHFAEILTTVFMGTIGFIMRGEEK
ncbi:MAG: TetR/AcrR family transcriptional regulator [Oscillospiraceae bacterium]|nr:TetR/AcrR family transcriptional regulator [Oscillospiraceae bacterium]